MAEVETTEEDTEISKLNKQVRELRDALKDIASSSGGINATTLRTKARLALIRFE